MKKLSLLLKHMVEIEKVVFGGKGLTKLENGKTCFVSYVLPKEKIEIFITKEKKNFCEAVPKNILKASEYRVNPSCKYFSVCGGCDFQHISYDYQLLLKKQALEEVFGRIAKENIKVEKIVPSSPPLFYRNKIQLKYDGSNLGFFKEESNDVVNIEECVIADEDINKAIKFLKDFLRNKDFIREVHIYKSSSNKSLIKFISTDFFQLNFEHFKEDFPLTLAGAGIYKDKRRVKTYGDTFVFETVGKFTYRVSIDSFFQVNKFQVENFINQVLEEIPNDKSKVVGDIFCGVGTLTLPIAKKVKKTFGIELNRYAVKDAKYNAKINSVNNVNFYDTSASKALDLIFGFNPNIIVFDPPRSGVSKKLLETISKLKSLEKIIYVSCYPPTLARDVYLLKTLGFKLEKVQMIDMFPQTHHIETIAVLSKT